MSENNNNRLLGVRDNQQMASVIKNLTRDNSSVVTHIMGAAVHLHDHLRTIHEGCKMIFDRYDGQDSGILKNPEFRNLARQVFRFIQEQKPGRKIFLISLSSPHLGLDTTFFAYYLTSRVITQADLALMTPFLDSLLPEEVPMLLEATNELPDIPHSPVLPV